MCWYGSQLKKNASWLYLFFSCVCQPRTRTLFSKPLNELIKADGFGHFSSQITMHMITNEFGLIVSPSPSHHPPINLISTVPSKVLRPETQT